MDIKPSFPRLAKTSAPGVLFGAIAMVWLASLFIINPLGNFPLNDDWSFGLAVEHLMKYHEFRPTEWTAMSLLTNVLWGGLFCLPAGFSFTALRLSSLTASILGILGIYCLAKQARLPRWLTVIAILTLAFNPVYYALSNTFMTDVLFAAIFIFAAFFLLRHLKSEANSDLAIGTALIVLATLSRQLAIAMPLAFAIVWFLKRGFRSRDMLRAVIPAVVAIGTLIVFQHWLTITGRLPAVSSGRNQDLIKAIVSPNRTLPNFAYNAYVSLVYLGLFLSPVGLCSLAGAWKEQRKKIVPIFGLSIWAFLLATVLYRSKGAFMPICGNVLTEAGIGPRLLRDTEFLNINFSPAFPDVFWQITTCLSLLGAAALVTLVAVIIINLILKARQSVLSDGEITAAFLLLSAIIYLPPVLLTGVFFDRYLIPIIPLLAIAIPSALQPAGGFNLRLCSLPALILFVSALLAVGGTRDYLAWNRLRWQATDNLMANDHIKPSEIDGGFEFNGFYLYDPHYQKQSHKSTWWVQNDTYQISNGPVPGYQVIHEYSYVHWLPRYTGKVLVLQKSTQGNALKKQPK
jgi:hypothetical protein